MSSTSNPRRWIDWTAEQDQLMITLRRSNIAWKDISEKVGRSVEACSSRYRAILPKEQRAVASRDRWTDIEVATLKELMDQQLSPQEIAVRMGKSRSAVYSKGLSLQRKQATLRLERVPRIHVPDRCLEDRDRRLAAERSLTAEFFGDPAPGQSALDKRQGAYA